MKYAIVFLLLSLTCAFYALTSQGWALCCLAFSCALAFGGVGLAYAFIGPRAFLKQKNGRLPALSWILYWPYHALNALSLWTFRRSARENDFDEIAPNLYLGCHLNRRDRARMEELNIVSVLDLTSEFGEISMFRHLNYRCVPLLDTRAPSLQLLEDGAKWIEQAIERGPIYVHCALGHGRSATFIAAYLMISGEARTAQEAITHIKIARPTIGLTRAQIAVLEQLNQSK